MRLGYDWEIDPKKLMEWHSYFAWYPIKIGYTYVWLEYIERRWVGLITLAYYYYRWREYRLKKD